MPVDRSGAPLAPPPAAPPAPPPLSPSQPVPVPLPIPEPIPGPGTPPPGRPASGGGITTPTAPESQSAADVRRVVDGHTIEVTFDNGARATVRLIGIDTPETVDPRREVQC
jgi:endonuclease YncB( thermonuclease family)